MSAPVREAAVLVPFWRDDRGDVHVLLIERTMRGRWGGQLACPGGFREPGDADLEATAVREAGEEVGLPAADVTVLEALAPRPTHVPDVRVQPFVARVRPRADRSWSPQESEVAAVLEVPARALLDPASRATITVPAGPDGGPVEFPAIAIGARRLWGLTLQILEPLLPDALAGRWDL